MAWFEIVAQEVYGEAVFLGFTLKGLSAFKMDKIVTRGRLSVHHQEAPQLSKEWEEGQYVGIAVASPAGAALTKVIKNGAWKSSRRQ